VALVALVCAAPARAQQDVGGAKDHPLFPRITGYFIVDSESSDEGHEFDVNQSAPQQIDGHFTHLSYKIKTGAKKTAPQQIGRYYTGLAITRGGTRFWERFDAAGGRTTASIAPAEAGDKGAVYLQVEITGGGEYYDVYIVEQAAGKQPASAGLTAPQIADALKTKGRVVVPGLVFDAGKGSIKPQSMATLAIVAAALKSDPSLKVEIQAHADNATTAQARANVVKVLLVTNHDVADARLTATGIRDARTDVELIRK